jgi:DNA-binding response OmpR family regulator
MKKILVIEDHTPMRINLVELLQMNGYKVIPAADGQKGIELVNAEKPDLILCDVIIPQINGYEVYSMVRQNEATAHIPFVFMTGGSFFDHGLARKEHQYLTKPFGHQELLDTIRIKLKETQEEMSPDRNRLEHTEVLEYVLNSISHEMRNPICSTLGLASLLEFQTSRKRNTDETKKIVEGIKANAARLNEITGMITDVLHKAIQNYRNTKTM